MVIYSSWLGNFTGPRHNMYLSTRYLHILIITTNESWFFHATTKEIQHHPIHSPGLGQWVPYQAKMAISMGGKPWWIMPHRIHVCYIWHNIYHQYTPVIPSHVSIYTSTMDPMGTVSVHLPSSLIWFLHIFVISSVLHPWWKFSDQAAQLFAKLPSPCRPRDSFPSCRAPAK